MFAVLAALLVASGADAAPPLVTPAELAAQPGNGQLRIVDIRDGKTDGKTAFEVGHIGGAQHAPYANWRGPSDNPGQLPAEAALTALLQKLGIDASTPVVVVHEGKDATDFGAAARVYWTLKAAGVAELSILNGGVGAWRAAGLPLTTEVTAVAPSRFTVRLDPRLIATRDEVRQVLDAGSTQLVDARPATFFTGDTRHPAARAPGTIVGARNVSHEIWFDKGSMLPADDIRRTAQQAGISGNTPTISFCNTGHWAATNWFVLSEVLGHDNVSLYPESVVDWSRAGLAMDNVPNRLRQFWLQLRLASGAP